MPIRSQASLTLMFLGLSACGVAPEVQLMNYTGAAFDFVFNAVILNHPIKNFSFEGPYTYVRRYCSKQEVLDIKSANKIGDIILEDSIIKKCDISDYYYVEGFFEKKRLGYKMDLYDKQDCIKIATEYNKLAEMLKNHPPIDPADRDFKIVYVNNIQYQISYSNVSLFKGAKINKAECNDETVYLTVRFK